jgi:hypothetical protein
MNPRTLSWTVIAIAAVLLALLVIVLARLRWIQTRPIKACVFLSVFAHLLLLAVFQLSRVFDLPFIPPGDQSIVVHLVFDGHPEIPSETTQDQPPPPVPDPDVLTPSLTPVPEDSPPMADLSGEKAADDEVADVDEDEIAEDEVVEPQTDEVPDEVSADAPSDDAPREPDSAAEPDLATTQNVDDGPTAPTPLDRALIDAAEPMTTQDASAQEAETPADSEPLVPESPRDMTSTDPDGTSPESFKAEPAESTVDEERWESASPRHQVPLRYRDRIDRPSEQELVRRGGSPQAQAAVEAALNWLSNVQEPDGSWSAAQYGAGRGRWVEGQDRGATGLKADTGITGLALLSFLGAGHTSRRGLYREQVGQAIAFLSDQQDQFGCLGGNAGIYARMYCHGIATLSLCEAAAISGDEAIGHVAQQAINYTLNCQHRETGGWRYRPGDHGDMSQFGWQLMALVSAREAGLNVPAHVDARLQRFLLSVRAGRHGGLASYRPGHVPSHSMTAEALACRRFLSSHSQLTDTEAAEYISSMRPGHGPRNFYYWYYASLALSQLNNEYWPAWNRALQKQLLPTQRRHGRQAGSWDPDTVWGRCGGRVYTTALATLCLESYYRYAPAQVGEPAKHDSQPPVAQDWSTRGDRR